MARAALASRGASTVVPPASTVAGTSKAKVISTAALGIRQVFFTSADLAEPDKLYQVISKLQDFLVQALSPIAQDPIIGGTLLQGQVVGTPGQVLQLSHGLGRPYRGYIVTRAIGGYPSCQEVALPSGVTSSQMLALQFANAGTFDIKVF